MVRGRIALLLLLLLALLCGCTAQDVPQTTVAPQQQEPTGYVRITVGSESRWIALPVEGERRVNLTQRTEEEELVNVVLLTPDGVTMEASTCHNQDCVEQGTVTLQNRETRVLTNWIICLPHQVSIELFTPQELADMGVQPQEEI